VVCPFRVCRLESSGRPRGLPALVGLSGPWGSGCACLFAEVVCSSSSSVAGRWPFPHPPRPSGFPGILEVFRPPSSRWSPTVRPSPSLPPLQCPRLVTGWSSQPSSLGIHSAPPSTSPRASTPGVDPKIVSIGSRLPHRKSRSVLVVSHHLDGLLRSELAGLLHPAIDPGVRRVSEVRLHDCPTEAEPSMRNLFPATHTPRRTSSSSAVPRHRGRCLLAVALPFAPPSQGMRSEPDPSRLTRSRALRSRRCRRFGGWARDGRLRGLAPSTSS